MAGELLRVHGLKNCLRRFNVFVGAKRTRRKHSFLFMAMISCSVALLSACAPIVPNASLLNIDETRIPDPAKPPTEAEMDALEAQARNGDWTLKVFFANAYFHEKLEDPRHWANEKCAGRFTHAYVCRAAAERTEAAEIFLREVLEHPDPRFFLLRGRFGESRVRDAYRNTPYTYLNNIPDRSDDPACKEAMHYLKRAVQEEIALSRTKSSCSFARKLGNMAFFGQCIPKDKNKASDWFGKSSGCPMP